MKHKADYTLVGLFVVFLTVLLFGAIFWLSAECHDRQYAFYQINFAEGVTGLQQQSLVRYNGVSVGFVKSIQLNPKNPQLVHVVIGVVEGTPITVATIAKLTMQGITGSVYIELEASQQKAKPLISTADKLAEIQSQPSLLVKLSEVLPQLTTSLNAVGQGIKSLLSYQNRQAISDTFHNTQEFTKALAESSEALQQSIQKLEATLKNTAKASQDLPKVVASLNTTLQQVTQTGRHVSHMAESVASMAHSGDTLLSHFSQQFLPSVQQTTSQLKSLIRNVNTLSQKLNRNPSILVRGQQPPLPGPGE